MTQLIATLTEYQDWQRSIKQRVLSSRLRAALAANSDLIALYYKLGARIVEREAVAQWGSGFIDTFSKDLRQTFLDIGGFSPKNLRYCQAFFRLCCAPAIWQQAVANKLNFYLSTVDSLLKRDDDQPTIGLLLCRDKNNIEVEFARSDMNKTMGVSEYTLTETLPDNLKGSMPTVEEIEQDLQQLREDVAE